MEIKEENPPYNVRQKCEATFDLSQAVPVWTFGETIYNPHKGHIDAFLITHEACHARQQDDTPEQWWDDYLAYEKFRFKEELEAYRVEYEVMRRTVTDRNFLAKMLYFISADLAGGMYGRMCSQAEAAKLIKEGL